MKFKPKDIKRGKEALMNCVFDYFRKDSYIPRSFNEVHIRIIKDFDFIKADIIDGEDYRKTLNYIREEKGILKGMKVDLSSFSIRIIDNKYLMIELNAQKEDLLSICEEQKSIIELYESLNPTNAIYIERIKQLEKMNKELNDRLDSLNRDIGRINNEKYEMRQSLLEHIEDYRKENSELKSKNFMLCQQVDILEQEKERKESTFFKRFFK